MGTLALAKVNFDSIKRQLEIEAAVEAGDTTKASQLIHESILSVLKAGLTSRQLGNFDELKAKNNEEISDLITEAFDRGWWRNGQPNLSNALDEVLLVAVQRVREGRTKGECVESERAFFDGPSPLVPKRNALFWFVGFLLIAVFVFRYTTGWWTLFGYLASFMSFGALLEFLKKRKGSASSRLRHDPDFDRILLDDADNVAKYNAIENPTKEQVFEEVRRRERLLAKGPRIMNQPQRIILLMGAVAIALITLFPPWAFVYQEGGLRSERFAGYHPIWQSNTPMDASRLSAIFAMPVSPNDLILFSVRIDGTRLAIQICGAVLITTLLAAVMQKTVTTKEPITEATACPPKSLPKL